MKEEKIIKICDGIFTRGIRKAKINWQNFNTAKYERELYHSAIKSFKIDFMKSLKRILSNSSSDKSE